MAADSGSSAARELSPAPAMCIGRRFMAKVVDAALFGALSIAVGRLLIPDQFSFGSIVPAFGTAIWVLGFFVASDTIAAQVFGATPGELIAGIRVRMTDGSNLTWSARQARTTDALVDGTLGAVGLIRAILTGRQAAYDRDWRVHYLRAGVVQRIFVGTATAMSLLALLLLLIWLTVAKGFGTDLEVASRKVLHRLGFPIQDVWVNPITGLKVELPPGWIVTGSLFRQNIADMYFVFNCPDGGAVCQVKLGTTPEANIGMLRSNEDTSEDAIERHFKDLVLEQGALVLEGHPAAVDDARLDQIYKVSLDTSQASKDVSRIGFCWFTERKHTWVLATTAPRITRSAEQAEHARTLALALIQSSRGRSGQ